MLWRWFIGYTLASDPLPHAKKFIRDMHTFSADPRVVEIPRAVWLPLLYGLILPLRSKKSAAKYATIWTPEGSPLKVWTERQARRLQGWLGEHGHRVRVRYAMRYGNPSIASELDALADAGANRILVLPAYPQYSGTTTASVIDAVADWSRTRRSIPELRFVNRYHDDRGYVQALARRIQLQWREHGRPEVTLTEYLTTPHFVEATMENWESEFLQMFLFVFLTAPIWATFLQTLKNAYTGYNAVSAYQIQPTLLLGFFDEIFYRVLMGEDRVFAPYHWYAAIRLRNTSICFGSAA